MSPPCDRFFLPRRLLLDLFSGCFLFPTAVFNADLIRFVTTFRFVGPFPSVEDGAVVADVDFAVLVVRVVVFGVFGVLVDPSFRFDFFDFVMGRRCNTSPVLFRRFLFFDFFVCV